MSMIAKRSLLCAMVSLTCLFAAGAGPVPKEEQSLWIEEAQAVVELYEIRLHNVERNAEMEDLKWHLVKENFMRIDEANKSGAINEHDYRAAKYEYDVWTQKDKIKDIQEAQVNLKLAQIRMKIAKAGFRPYGKIGDYGRE